jgi:general secretion pathway protein C
MLARLSAFVIWALVAATAVFWGLRLWARSAEAPPYTVPVGDVAVARGDLSRLLGATPAAAAAVVATPEAASRFRLIGIMAPKSAAASAQPGQGVALIAVDGKPPKAFVVGSALDTDMVLQSVSLRSASIGPAQGTAAVTLELPPLAAAATGTLPASGFGAPRNPATVPPAPPVQPVASLRSPQAPAVPPGTVPMPMPPMTPAGPASMPRDPAAQTLTQ